MPKVRAQNLTPAEKEKYFISLYVKAGADEQVIPTCAKRAHLRELTARKILKKKSVQQEIQRRLEPVRQEQLRQEIIGEAVEKAKAAQQDELRKTVASVQRRKIDLEELDHQLMCGVVGLDWNLYPKEKLDAIKAAYVVFGTLESGNTRRLIPPEHLQQNDGQGTYTALFNRLALKSPSEVPLEALPEQEGVYDLIPQAQPSVAIPGPFPPPGEAIQEPPPTLKSDPNVITVEIE